jgi:copper chaperone CopZ
METTTVRASGIVCDGCANAVKVAVAALPGVARVVVTIPQRQVVVSHDGLSTRADIESALIQAGFEPES